MLCNDDFIRKLNKERRDEDHATDVLSMSQHVPGLDLPILMLGDIVISAETAARQAEERGHALIDEIRVLLVQVHGSLHLLGFDHEISEEAEVEMEEEGVLLESLGWKGKGLIQSAYDAETTMNHLENSDGRMKAVFDSINQNSAISSAIWMDIAEQQKPNLLDQCKGIERGFVKGCEGGDRNWKKNDIFTLLREWIQPYDRNWSEATGGRATVVQAVPDMLEIASPGTSKGSGVKLLLDHLGVIPKEIMAIGDGENDIEMLELASLGIALGNGTDKTKTVASVIGASNDEDGVADAIYRLPVCILMYKVKYEKLERR